MIVIRFEKPSETSEKQGILQALLFFLTKLLAMS